MSKYQSQLSAMRATDLGKLMFPSSQKRVSAAVSKVDDGFRKECVDLMKRMKIEVEGQGVMPLAFVDKSRDLGVGVCNRELAFMGTPVVHMFVRSWVLQSLSGYQQRDIDTIIHLLLSPGHLTSAYTALPCSHLFLASSELTNTIHTSLTTGTPNPITETFFTTQLYSITGAIYLEKGLPAAFDFLNSHLTPHLLD
eukprot:TRINITY_DN17984_c0_g1_i1.p1 TRINITY_DN17984_c0_g1~~TRINITY_DN17984_c0_g1_i1.p1  ORF type:complete len:196 (+),score=26.85 TRINITY_DN17984_c0_g1_i1:37-624(+)